MRVTLSAECIGELQWWEANFPNICSRVIRDVPLGRPFDSTIKSDAIDTGVGAVTNIDGAGVAPSTLMAASVALAPTAVSRCMVARHA
jgi:hypothetical protein